jgi:hypothetical protein
MAGGWFWYVGGVLLAASVAWIAKGLAALTGPPGSALAAVPDDALSALGTAGACALAGVLFLVVPVLRWRQSVEVFERGIVWRRWPRTITLAGEEVRAVRLIHHRRRAGSYSEVVVQRADGSRLSMAGVERPEQLANLIAAFAQPAAVSAAPAIGAWVPPGR